MDQAGAAFRMILHSDPRCWCVTSVLRRGCCNRFEVCQFDEEPTRWCNGSFDDGYFPLTNMVPASTEPFQPSAKLVSKAEEIHRVLNASTVDVWKLREFALSDGGLVDGTSCDVSYVQ
jgi:hypothetical protein